ncbi:MAG: hypothetical protein ACREQ5_41230 [Candidatus Dormibacteria bacterium]
MLLAADVLTWCQTLLLTDTADLARAEPKIPRYRLLHTAARLTTEHQTEHSEINTDHS